MRQNPLVLIRYFTLYKRLYYYHQYYLSEGRFTWGHDSAPNFLASTFQCLNHCTFYVDLPQYLSPSLVTGDDLRPDMLISNPSNTLCVLELSVGFETNPGNNASRKFTEYRYLLSDLTSKYRHVEFVNLSIGSLGIFGQSCDIAINTGHTNYIIAKFTSIIMLTTFYIFCMRNKLWTNPDLLSYQQLSFILWLFLLKSCTFIRFVSLEIPVSRPAECKLPMIR